MAHLFKPTYTDRKTGKQRKTKKWYGCYRDAQGIERKPPLSTNKDAAKLMLADLVKKAELAQAGIVDPFESHSKRPVVEHVKEFKAFLAAKGTTAKHVSMTTRHVDEIVSACGVVWLREISGSAVMEAVADLRKAGKSLRTCNAHLVSIKAFSRWLWKDRYRR